MRRTPPLLLAALVATVAVPVATAAPPPKAGRAADPAPAPHCTDRDDRAVRFTLRFGDKVATGFYSLPNERPSGFVVFSHGYGHSSFSWQEHLRRVSAELGVVTVVMDGRGLLFPPDLPEKRPGIPSTRGWPVQSAAEDGVAAARYFVERCRGGLETVVNYGVSMGGNTSGLMATVPKLFDWWIDVEGATTLAETYLQARVLAPFNSTAANAVQDIERETGGPIEAVPDAYRLRTIATRTRDIARSGVLGVVVIHGVDDGLVTHDQSHQLVSLLRRDGVPVDSYTVTFRSNRTERETTASGYAGGEVDPRWCSPFAGHASEMSTTHIVSALGFQRLAAIFGGDVPMGQGRTEIVDGRAQGEPVSSCPS